MIWDMLLLIILPILSLGTKGFNLSRFLSSFPLCFLGLGFHLQSCRTWSCSHMWLYFLFFRWRSKGWLSMFLCVKYSNNNYLSCSLKDGRCLMIVCGQASWVALWFSSLLIQNVIPLHMYYADLTSLVTQQFYKAALESG